MLPPSIPIFPLPSVVLFPKVFLPLHIFEPRYRQMVAEALSGDRIIGMTLLKPGHEADYEGQPPVYDTGCSGVITHAERLEDGRFNLVLHGLEKFRVLGEEAPEGERLYRRAVIDPLVETVTAAERAPLSDARARLEALLEPILAGTHAEHRLPPEMADEDLVNALAQYLDFAPVEKLALLEQPGPLARCRSIIELLEMRALARRVSGGDQGTVH